MSKLKNLGLGLAVASLLPVSSASAQLVGSPWCGDAYLSACATINSIVFSGDQVTLQVTNSSTVGGGVLSTSFIGAFMFLFQPSTLGDLKEPTLVEVTIDGSTVEWNVSSGGGDGGFQVTWDAGGKAGGDHRLVTGETATIVITFDGFVGSGYELAQWSAHMQGLGVDGEDSDWTTDVVPEPISMVLLATGLAGLGGVGLRRRRRGTEDA